MAAQCDKTPSSDPNYVPALVVLALAQEKSGNFKQAAQIYDQVLQRYPLFSPATLKLAILYFERLADDKKAYDLATKVYETYPHDPDLARTLGILVYRRGDYSRSAQLLKQSAQTRKDDAELLYYLGMAQYRLKARMESKAALQQSLALNVQAKLAEDARRILAELK
jgi:tetratricopeptide (TPR) repeat protein